jgi:hypothetical protein
MAGVVSHLPVAKVQLLRHAASPSGSPPSTSSAFSGQSISKSMTVPAPHRHRGTCVCAQKDEKPKDKEKQGFLSGVAEALDFAAVSLVVVSSLIYCDCSRDILLREILVPCPYMACSCSLYGEAQHIFQSPPATLNNPSLNLYVDWAFGTPHVIK